MVSLPADKARVQVLRDTLAPGVVPPAAGGGASIDGFNSLVPFWVERLST